MPSRKCYEIALHGCDDSTYFAMMLSRSELILVEQMVKLSKESSTYGCMPTMTVKEMTKDADEA